MSPIIDAPGEQHGRPKPFYPTYVTRRRLERGELLAAGGIAAGVAAAAFYLATIWIERTPLLPEEGLVRPGVRPRARPRATR